MNKITVYLSGAIEKVKDHKFHGKGWRQLAKKELDSRYFNVIDPYDLDPKPFTKEAEMRGKLIVERDKAAIIQSDIVLLSAGHDALGTWMELLFAWENHKPVFAFGDCVNPWYVYHVSCRCSTLDEAIRNILIRYLNLDQLQKLGKI